MAVTDGSPALEPAETSTHRRMVGVGLEQTRQGLEATLEAIAEQRSEARRLITRELGFEPGPEVLRTVVRIAVDRSATGPLHELPRQLLAVRVMSDRELRDLLEAEPLDPERIADSRRALGEVFEATLRLESRVRETLPGLAVTERDLLLQITDCLIPHPQKLRSARVLAQRLEMLSRAAQGGELAHTVSALSADEVSLIETAATHSSEDGGCCRVRLDATAIRSLLEEDIAGWKQLTSFLGSPDRDERRIALGRVMAGHQEAYRFVSRRLQYSLDEAVNADLIDFAEELRETRRRLYATHLEFSPLAERAQRLAETGSHRPAGLRGLMGRLALWNR